MENQGGSSSLSLGKDALRIEGLNLARSNVRQPCLNNCLQLAP